MLQIPSVLRKAFLQELIKVADDPTNPLCITSLLSLAYCRSLGFSVGDDASRDFALEAARLGSIIGKRVTLLWSVMQRSQPPIDHLEESEWMLDVLLDAVALQKQFLSKSCSIHFRTLFSLESSCCGFSRRKCARLG
jgi:hypothetical protein